MACGVRSQRALLRDSGRVRYEDLRVETAAQVALQSGPPRPGTLRSCCCRSVRQSPGACYTALSGLSLVRSSLVLIVTFPGGCVSQ
jgi:hypothetical protein